MQKGPSSASGNGEPAHVAAANAIAAMACMGPFIPVVGGGRGGGRGRGRAGGRGRGGRGRGGCGRRGGRAMAEEEEEEDLLLEDLEEESA